MTAATQKPWYRHFWPWFIIAVPFTSMVLGVTMIYLALHSSNDLVKEDYYKEGLAINVELGKRRIAKEMNVQAVMTVDDLTGEVLLKTENTEADSLSLVFTHAAYSEKDFNLNAVKIAPGEYRAHLERPLTEIWNVYLESAEGWQMTGRINGNISQRLNFNL